MPLYRLLSLDGGGIRGLLTIVLLQRLEAARPGFLSQIDLFAGTSAGGILALGLAAGFPPQRIAELYRERGRQVFADSIGDNIRDLGLAIGAQYGHEPLKSNLEEIFGPATLQQLPKKVLIASFDLDNEAGGPGETRTWKAKFFHNYPGPDSDGGERIVDVAIRSSVAPVYFPTYQGYIDGGVVANNPAVCAVAQAIDPGTGGQQIGDLALLSLGSGHNPRFLPVANADWGWLQWILRLRILEVMLDGSAGLADYQCQRLLGGRYHRLNPRLPHAIDLDGVDEIPLLQEIAEQVDLTTTLAWVDQFFNG